ncbi:MAG: cation:proton antiporter [Candidatus Micrarchaeaceae archaeon]
MEVLVALLLLLSFSILLGRIFERFGITEIVGQIISGVILGPSILGFVSPSPTLSGIAEVSIFFILLFIGIQITTEVLTGHIKSSVYFTLSSFIIPLLAMFLVSVYLFKISFVSAFAVAIALGVPSISIVSVLVYRRSIINEEDGLRILSGVVMTDLIAFILLAILLHEYSIIKTTASLVAFFAILIYAGRYTSVHGKKIKKVFNNLVNNGSDAIIFAIVIIFGLIISAILQEIGITYVLGALFAGLLIHPTTVGERSAKMLSNTFRRLNDSFFIPVFFSIAGLEFAIPKEGYIILLVALVGITMCVGGALNFLVAQNRFRKVNPRDAIGILGGRGAVGIIIATLALQNSIISNQLYTVVLVGTITLSIIMPLALTKKKEKEAIIRS